MTLYELVNLAEKDFDTYDTEFDSCVTVCHIGKESDNYDKFCNEIMKRVNIVNVNNDNLIVNWSELIKRNMEIFKVFAREHWIFDYENDEDEFVYQWIKEIHYYLAGYVDEDTYEELVELVENLI